MMSRNNKRNETTMRIIRNKSAKDIMGDASVLIAMNIG